jgi:FHA domain/Domain of unknown function (DUF1707)
VRASQAERDEAVSELRERFVAGQLSQDTFVARVEIALAARDHGQLAALFADLRGPRRRRMPGWRALAGRMAAGSRAGGLPTGGLRAGGLRAGGSRAGGLRASAAVAPVREALARTARWLSPPPRPSVPPVPAELPFPVGSQLRFTIGRGPDCDLVVPDITVSWQHAGLDRGHQGWLLIDFGSTNGTRLNGWRVREPVPVAAGDQVSFGAVTFVLRPSYGPGRTP